MQKKKKKITKNKDAKMIKAKKVYHQNVSSVALKNHDL